MEKIILLGKIVLDFVKNLPLTDLLAGIVIPIVAAWISYYLAESAIRRKENNRLYIQIELLRKELQINDNVLREFLDSVVEKNKLEKMMECQLVSAKDFLVTILDELQKIKQKYMRSDSNVCEKPTQAYILKQELESLEIKIEELTSQGWGDEYLEQKRKDELSKLLEQEKRYFENLKRLKDKNIYNEFLEIQHRMEKLAIGDILKKENKEDSNYNLAKYIYDKIKTFNDKENKTKEDVLSLCKDLVIFEIDPDIIKDNCFNQEKFDLYYKAR